MSKEYTEVKVKIAFSNADFESPEVFMENLQEIAKECRFMILESSHNTSSGHYTKKDS
jgi:hypothetical protein